MTTATQLIPIEEYLRTSYRPDCEFVDGELRERNVGEREHNRLQLLLGNWFYSKEKEWGIYVLPEQRTRVSSQKVRIPDVCLLRADSPRERVTTITPLLCIEILSPEDRLPRVASVLDDHLAMGVKNLWILDPIDRVAYTYSGSGNLKLEAIASRYLVLLSTSTLPHSFIVSTEFDQASLDDPGTCKNIPELVPEARSLRPNGSQ